MFFTLFKVVVLALLTLVYGVRAASAFTPVEERAIRTFAAGFEGLESADAVLSPGVLSSTARTLAPLLRVCDTPEVSRGLTCLLEHKLLHDASDSYRLRDGDEACGPYRHVTRTVFKPGVVTAATAFFLYFPDTGEYALGGVLVPGTQLDVLVRREDAVYGAMLPDGRLVFVPERSVRLGLPPSPLAPRLERVERTLGTDRDAYSYSAVRVGQALVHVVRVDLTQLKLTMAVSPFYNSLAHGPERTLPVDGMARRAGARVALNGTFFIDKSTHPNYGFPIGSFIMDGQVAWNLVNPQLLRFERSYAAFTDDRRLILGSSALSGADIKTANMAGQFDREKFAGAKIQALGTGFGWLVRDRKTDAWRTYAGKQFDASYYALYARRARSLLGVDATGRQAYLVAQEEGPGSPVPMSMPDLSDWMAARVKLQDMVFLDGGGSTQLVIEGKNVSAPADGSYRKNSTAVLFIK